MKYEADITRVDPLTCAADLRERAKAGRVLMLNGVKTMSSRRPRQINWPMALGIRDQVVWFEEGLGHYTAIAVLPQTFQRTVEFFCGKICRRKSARPVADEPPAGSPTQILADYRA